MRAVNADRIESFGAQRQLLFQTELMYPLIVEVVFVEEALPDSETKTGKGNVAGMVRKLKPSM